MKNPAEAELFNRDLTFLYVVPLGGWGGARLESFYKI